MCGILGYASAEPLKEDLVASGVKTLRHRGPDDEGIWWSSDRRVCFGHRRLAIIDLTPGGHQPMVDGHGEIVIAFNGEIYNFTDLKAELSAKGHCFKTASDTEVLLAAYREWDVECLQRLNGMFAFALYDLRKRRLFLARDRAGEKPLYYYRSGSSIGFASELKALLNNADLPRKIDPQALDCYLAFGYVPGERCILQGVSKLAPAHALCFNVDSSACTTWRYWQLPRLAEGASSASHESLLDELEWLLEDSVRRQLVADVPVGVLLSGGVDSSLVTAMASRARGHVKTFTVRFPDVAGYDESQRARLIAGHFDTEHIELKAAPTSVHLLPLLARQFDEPIADSSMIPTYLVSELIRQHCTVALGGDGGDELFGGYGHYRRVLWLQARSRWVPLRLRRKVAATSAALLPVGLRGRNWLQALAYDYASDIPAFEEVFDDTARGRLMNGSRWIAGARGVRSWRMPQTADTLQRATRMDFENYLAEDLLVKVDRASMLNSLEVRAPFLDHRIVEFAFSKVPSSLKATSNNLKVLLKQLCARALPSEFDQNHKWGFSIPLVHWLRRGPWAEFFRAVLLDPEQQLFSKPLVESLLKYHVGRNNGERLFALTMFELWRREYRASL